MDRIFKSTNVDISNEVRFTVRNKDFANRHIKNNDSARIMENLRREKRRK